MATTSYHLKDEISKDELLNDPNFQLDAAMFLIDRGGYSAADVSNKEDIYDNYMEHFRSQNVNEVTALKDLTYAQEAGEEDKAQFGRLMDTYDKMDSDFGFKAAGDYLEGIFTAPSTYAGAFSFGTAKVGALAANQGIKLGVRQALRTGIGSAVVEGIAGGATVAAQEGTRVETGIKEEMDLGNIGLATALSAGTGGALGGFTGYMRGVNNLKADEILKSTTKVMDDATLKAHSKATIKTFKNKKTSDTAKTFQDQLLANLDAETKKLAKSKKRALRETVPAELEKGKKLREELSDGDLILSIGAKEIQNIAAAASEVFHKIGPHPTLKNPAEERFTSRVARGLTSGVLDENSFGKILNDHNITTEQLGALYAAELSSYGVGLRSGRMLKDIGKKENYIEIVTRLNEIDEATQSVGTITSKSREALDDLQIKGTGAKIAGFFQHINKARIGMMTIQPATTMRNTTNGYLRNYVYMMDNFGASMVDYAKGNLALLRNPTDAMVKKHSEDLVRRARAQARTGFQALHFKDLKMGIESANTQALFKLLGDKKFGNQDIVKKLLRQMADIADVTDQSGGLIGVARNLNKLNAMSDNMFKRAIFSRELDKNIGMNPISIKRFETGPGGEQISTDIVLDSLDKVLRTGNFSKIDAKTLSDSMTEAFDFTYQTGSFRGREGSFNKFADFFIDVSSNNLLVSSVIPFPKYLINQFRFLYEHTPVLGMVNTLGVLNKPGGKAGQRNLVDLSSDTLGKQLGGLAILGTFMAARANFGDETTGAYEYLDPTSGGTFNAEALIGPFSAHAALADALYRMNPGGWHDNDRVANTKPFDSRRLLKAITGGNIRAGTSLDMMEGMVEILNKDIDSGKTEREIQDNLAKWLGNYINTFTVGAGTLKDLQAQIDPSVRQLPDNTDVNMWNYFFKQAGRSLPTMGIDYGKVQDGGREQLASPTRSTGVRKLNPILKQLTGLTPQQEKTGVERELARLQFDYQELSPARIKFDKPLSNQARQRVGEEIEKNIGAFMLSDKYTATPDAMKRVLLKGELNAIRRRMKAEVLDPSNVSTEEERERIARAKFLNLSRDDRIIIENAYRTQQLNDCVEKEDLKTIAGSENWSLGLAYQQ